VAAATAFLIAGALGNAWQRLLAPNGVVDFIDVGFGDTRFWVFNIADVAVYVGAGLLLLAASRTPTSARRPS
jgi:signal peptidase II